MWTDDGEREKRMDGSAFVCNVELVKRNEYANFEEIVRGAKSHVYCIPTSQEPKYTFMFGYLLVSKWFSF